MRKLWLAWLACLLVVAPLELSAKHIVKHRSARAQGCAVGQTPPSTGCGIGDMSVGGALSSTDAIAICQQAGGCPASASTWQLTKVPLMSSIRGVLSAAPPLTYSSSTGAFGCSTFSSSAAGCVSASGGGTSNYLRADGTWAPTSGTGGGTVTSVGAGTGLSASPSPIVGAGTISCVNFSSTLVGCVPASGGGTANFLRADGTWAAPPGSTGSGTVTSVALSPGFTTTPGTCNTTGTPQSITGSGTISGQTCIVTKTSSYSLVTADTGNLVIASGSGLTITAPNPTAGNQGVSYQIGGDGVDPYTVTTVGGTALFYGCTAAAMSSPTSTTGMTSLIMPGSYDLVITNDGAGTPGYKCTQMGAGIEHFSLSWGPGQNLSAAAIPLNPGGVRTRQIVGISCRPEVLASTSAAATLAVRWAASGTALTSGTDPTSGATCLAGNAGTAATTQSLAVNAATSTIPVGAAIGIVGAGAGWTSSVGSGVIDITYRGD